MIPDEIIRRRFPPSHGYRIPHSEFIDEYDPSYPGPSLPLDETDPLEEIKPTGTNPVETQGTEAKKHLKENEGFPSMLTSDYTNRVAADRTFMASDIRKYLASYHINPLGNPLRYIAGNHKSVRRSFL